MHDMTLNDEVLLCALALSVDEESERLVTKRRPPKSHCARWSPCVCGTRRYSNTPALFPTGFGEIQSGLDTSLCAMLAHSRHVGRCTSHNCEWSFADRFCGRRSHHITPRRRFCRPAARDDVVDDGAGPCLSSSSDGGGVVRQIRPRVRSTLVLAKNFPRRRHADHCIDGGVMCSGRNGVRSNQ